jgi:hypothetical protein
MRRVVAIALLGAGSVVATALPALAGPDQGTLIINAHDKAGVPRHFRSTSDPSGLDGDKKLAVGLDKLQASGSGQFSAKGFDAVVKRAGGRPLVVLDLRQESHGFVGGTPVSWFGVRNASNSGKSADQINRDESELLAGVAAQTTVTVK